MRRVARMRTLLREALEARGVPGGWSHVTAQIGMFSYTGLPKAACDALVADHHVYLLDTGRINVAGLNAASVPILADAIAAVVGRA
jgi:aspartate/tyrosine/aromatic aminotransferase